MKKGRSTTSTLAHLREPGILREGHRLSLCHHAGNPVCTQSDRGKGHELPPQENETIVLLPAGTAGLSPGVVAGGLKPLLRAPSRDPVQESAMRRSWAGMGKRLSGSPATTRHRSSNGVAGIRG